MSADTLLNPFPLAGQGQGMGQKLEVGRPWR